MPKVWVEVGAVALFMLAGSESFFFASLIVREAACCYAFLSTRKRRLEELERMSRRAGIKARRALSQSIIHCGRRSLFVCIACTRCSSE